MDVIFIRSLKCETTLGVYDWERVSLRPVLLDLEIGASSMESFEHDSTKGLMNYDSISKRLTEALKTLHYKTVERLAEQSFGVARGLKDTQRVAFEHQHRAVR